MRALVPIADLFAATVAGRRNDVAIECDRLFGKPLALTFGQLEGRANNVARLLAQRGVRQGDRLCAYLANGIGFVDVFLACMKLGAIFVPINVLYREREIAHIVSDAEPCAIVTHESAVPLFPDGAGVLDLDEIEAAAEVPENEDSGDPIRSTIGGEDPAAIIYTSGTTGRSKGAVLSHRNFVANAANIIASWRITSADRYLAVLPLFHVHGLGNGLISWIATGCRMRLVERFESSRAVDLFAAFRPTLFFGVPTIYVRLLEIAPEAAREIGATMRLFVSGSAPLPAHVFEAFRQRFGHAILERYGMSETMMNASNPYEGERRPGTVGFPLPGIDVRIVDAHGADVPAGDVGEVLVRGPNVFSGYWRQPDATAAAFVDGWFRTADLGERSADGYYTLRGRRTDMIISGGFNVYPREIEEVLLELPGIREAAVVGVNDPKRGEVPVAYVVTDQTLAPDELEAACRRALASFKVPRGFVRVDALPRTALGKIQKHLLPPWSADVS